MANMAEKQREEGSTGEGWRKKPVKVRRKGDSERENNTTWERAASSIEYTVLDWDRHTVRVYTHTDTNRTRRERERERGGNSLTHTTFGVYMAQAQFTHKEYRSSRNFSNAEFYERKEMREKLSDWPHDSFFSCCRWLGCLTFSFLLLVSWRSRVVSNLHASIPFIPLNRWWGCSIRKCADDSLNRLCSRWWWWHDNG